MVCQLIKWLMKICYSHLPVPIFAFKWGNSLHHWSHHSHCIVSRMAGSRWRKGGERAEFWSASSPPIPLLWFFVSVLFSFGSCFVSCMLTAPLLPTCSFSIFLLFASFLFFPQEMMDMLYMHQWGHENTEQIGHRVNQRPGRSSMTNKEGESGTE